MEELVSFANVAAIPIIVGVTQLLKKNFSFKYKSDVVSFVVALIICPGWWFWYTPEAEIVAALDGGVVEVCKFIMLMLITSVMTWSFASKSYDLVSGNKKRAERHEGEKQELAENHVSERENLSARIQELEQMGGGRDNEHKNDSKTSAKLLDILEGRS